TTAAGVAVAAGGWVHHLTSLLILWALAGIANAVANVSYETVLQQEVEPAYRGRVLAGCGAVLDAGYLVGVALAGTVASDTGLRGAVLLSGAVIAAGGLAGGKLLTGRPSHDPMPIP